MVKVGVDLLLICKFTEKFLGLSDTKFLRPSEIMYVGWTCASTNGLFKASNK